MEDCHMNDAFARRLQHQQMKVRMMSGGREKAENIENEGENPFPAKKLCFDDERLFGSPKSPRVADRFVPSEMNSTKLMNRICAVAVRMGGGRCKVFQAFEFVYLKGLSTLTVHRTVFQAMGSSRFRTEFMNFLMRRYIPMRSASDLKTKFSLLPEPKPKPKKNSRAAGEADRDKDLYSNLLRNEIVGSREGDENASPGLFTFTPPRAKPGSPRVNIEAVAPYSLSPVSTNSQLLLRCPRKQTRNISRIPFKVLDAPELQDDFYLNLVDWSSQNVLSVGLASCVYLWSATTSQVTRLCDLSTDNNSVTSVAWNERGNLVAVGTNHGHIEIWDTGALKQVGKLTGHSARIGTLAWNGEVLSSGSRDRSILQRDLRVPASESAPRRLLAHRQEVCGLKWSPDNQSLASGGNDNKLHIWNMHSVNPVSTYDEHLAAVKAIAWSPHHHGILASGGGTADRSIRFWNTLTGQAIQVVDTGSQVCNLAWSKHTSELVSTHGYSQNQILLWKYPSLTQVSKLTGHSYRVLYLAVSPCGESIVTGAGDETLRFWNVFSKSNSSPRQPVSPLSLFQNIR